MRALELKVPPVAQCLLAVGAMWVLARLAPATTFEMPMAGVLAGALALAAAGVGLAAVRHFAARRTTVNPLDPAAASTLVAHGVFGFSRNPMYLALLLALLAWGAWLANGAAFVVPVLFVLAMNRLQILPEERALAAKFGAEYEDYRRRVRRWL